MSLQHSSDNKNRKYIVASFPSCTALTFILVDTKNVYAVLHYDGAPNAEPTTNAEDGVSNLLKEYELAPLENPGAPGGSAPATRSIDLQFTRTVDNNHLAVSLHMFLKVFWVLANGRCSGQSTESNIYLPTFLRCSRSSTVLPLSRTSLLQNIPSFLTRTTLSSSSSTDLQMVSQSHFPE